MPIPPFNLAIETSGRLGSVTLGRDDEILATAELPPQERHRLDLMPAIDRLCRNHGAKPVDIGEIYLSIGPGSFTGLRIGVTTAKMFAQVIGCRIVAVPTLEVLARNVTGEAVRSQQSAVSSQNSGHPISSNAIPTSDIRHQTLDISSHLAVCLNLKRDTVYAGLFSWDGGRWKLNREPSVMAMGELLSHAPRPLMILGDPLPTPATAGASGPEAPGLKDVIVLPVELAVGRSVHVWALGRQRTARGEYVDAMKLLPLYVREPEAVELWNKKHGAV